MTTKYTKEILQEAVKASVSYAGVLRHLGLRQAGGTQSHIANCIRKYSIDTTHFTGSVWNKGKHDIKRKSASQILVCLPEGSNRPKLYQLKRAMVELGLTEQCECGIVDEWQGKPIVLEVDHINGDWLDNRIDNVRFICPNCHSQQTTSNMPHKYRIK